MVQPLSGSNSAFFGSNLEQVVTTMIELARLSDLHRAIVAGSNNLEVYLALRRRGLRVK
jgi:hypothetical protein